MLGDASSPHGSNCLQFNGNGTNGDSSKSTSPILPTSSANELSRQQLDLISQIMQQTKSNVTFTTNSIANNQKTIQRPRTWNMQVNYFCHL